MRTYRINISEFLDPSDANEAEAPIVVIGVD
jgi:hypothetical protein